MNPLFLLFILSALGFSAYADNFLASNNKPTYKYSTELQTYVQSIAYYKPETPALKKRLKDTIAYYKKVHILKTITTKSYRVDCIPFAQQPALITQPHLVNKMLSSVRQLTEKNWDSLVAIGNSFEVNAATQCPLGSVGIMRPSKVILTSERANRKQQPKKHLLRANPNYFHGGYSYQLGANSAGELISIETQANQAYFKGPQNQSVVNAIDHSLDQFWFTNNTYQQSIPVYSAEFGIIASQYFTASASTSIFVFASVDDYGSASCYNVECSNFVQMPNTPVLGNPTDTGLDYLFEVTHTTLTQYLNQPAYYYTLTTHDAATKNPAASVSVLLGYYADSVYPYLNELPKYFSAGSEVYSTEPRNGTLMYGNYMIPYVGYDEALHIEFSSENDNYFPYYITTGPAPYGMIWRLGQ